MIKGWSWTTTHYEDITGNPDGSISKNVRVQGGPFYYNPDILGYEFYAGFRPGAPWEKGGNEGLWVGFKRLMQQLGMSNLGFALRRSKG